MANNLTTVAENLILNSITGASGTALFTAPLKLKLVTAVGSESAAGTSVTGGSYADQTITFTTTSTGSATNTAAISFTGMPAATVTGFEIWDSNATPKRVWFFPATTSRTTAAGDTYNVAVGAITLSLD